MGGPPHPAGPGGASFELERLELERGRLVVSGWWFGVRGMRFVRPALVVKGRKVLATLEHKPWATSADGVWTAAFPWKDGVELDAGEVTLVVAPSVEVPLDREAIEAEVSSPAIEPIDLPDPRQTLRDELQALERQLAELREVLAAAAEDEARGRPVEQAAAGERGAAGGGELVRAHAMAVLDRDRAHAQREEAVVDREAAVRARTRMEAQRDEALAQREEAEARRDDVIAQRDDACRQRDEILLAHRALQRQLKGEWAGAERTRPPAVGEGALQAGDELTQPLPAADAPPQAGHERPQPLRAGELWRPNPGARVHKPLGARARPVARVRPVARARPVARVIAAGVQRVERALDHDASLGLWAVRILATVAALSFIWLVVTMLRAFFMF